MPKLVLLWTDVAIWLLLAFVAVYAVTVVRRPELARNWAKVFHSAPALASAMVLALCLWVTLLDSVHFRSRLPSAPPGANEVVHAVAYDTRTKSLLDVALGDLVATREATYSRPLSYLGFTKESLLINAEVRRVAPRLQFGGAHLTQPESQWLSDVLERAAFGAVGGVLVAMLLTALLLAGVARLGQRSLAEVWRQVRAPGQLAPGQVPSRVPWHVAVITLWVICLLAGPGAALSGPYHLLGTDLTGNDVLFQSLKSIRTAFVIGTLATVATLPLAVTLGLLAGYFKG